MLRRADRSGLSSADRALQNSEEDSDHMSEVYGKCDDRCLSLRRLFQQKLETGEELGAPIAVVRDGIPLVDLWGGWFDNERSTPWLEDTITATFQ